MQILKPIQNAPRCNTSVHARAVTARRAGKLITSLAIDAAGAPTSSNRDAASAREWIELIPAGVFHGRDGHGPFRLDDPDSVVAATIAMQMSAGLPIDYDHASDFRLEGGKWI
jgi:hypothetical protein